MQWTAIRPAFALIEPAQDCQLAAGRLGSEFVLRAQPFASVMTLRRAAIYGGTFDPVHNGHLEVARRVQKLFALDEVVFVPAYAPPHKRKTGITSVFHRFAMLALATDRDPGLRVSTIELDQPDRPYAVDTVARMQEKLGSGYRVFFMMGADSWLEFTTWRDWQRLLQMSDQIVMTRPGYPLEASSVDGARIADAKGLGADGIAGLIDESTGPRTFLSDAVFEKVSATEIREAARQGNGERLRQLVPSSVAGYIEKYGLYRK
jgi:nicotinate-nucleotide adenylyltransferase